MVEDAPKAILVSILAARSWSSLDRLPRPRSKSLPVLTTLALGIVGMVAAMALYHAKIESRLLAELSQLDAARE